MAAAPANQGKSERRVLVWSDARGGGKSFVEEDILCCSSHVSSLL